MILKQLALSLLLLKASVAYTFIIEGSIDDETEAAFYQSRIDNKNDRYLELYLHSPGGMVVSMFNIIGLANDMVKTTVVKENAASAAAVLFTIGSERKMATHARLLFHKARSSHSLTAYDMNLFLETGRSTTEFKTERCKEYSIETLKTMAKDLTYFDERLANELAKNLNKSVSWVNKYLLVDGKDVTIYGPEALELGIATKLI